SGIPPLPGQRTLSGQHTFSGQYTFSGQRSQPGVLSSGSSTDSSQPDVAPPDASATSTASEPTWPVHGPGAAAEKGASRLPGSRWLRQWRTKPLPAWVSYAALGLSLILVVVTIAQGIQLAQLSDRADRLARDAADAKREFERRLT